MLARLFIGLHFAVEIRHFDHPRLAHIFSFHKILKTISRAGLFIEPRRAKSISYQNVFRHRDINPLDAACCEHDIAYSHSNDLAERHAADNILAEKARKRITARDLTLRERAAATAVWAAMKAKTKIGMGLKTKKKKKKGKRILPIAKRSGVLPVLPLLGVLGSLVGGAAGVAKAVNDSKAVQRQLEELQRHNRVMEGRDVYLAPYKRGQGIARKKNIDETLKMPRGVTTDATTCKPYAHSIF
ncbi:hypothetical protein ALC57_18366 [Trachymyrmex cornetzi]|uniref:Uncharacterized protein n=1 Tax=Trachymyrmex cornetzi TaxID=471704 RepID=A0A151IS35_9HYME|nr:hypothetical protein ALC57_18366 [Trachymyrmex cornetzi]